MKDILANPPLRKLPTSDSAHEMKAQPCGGCVPIGREAISAKSAAGGRQSTVGTWQRTHQAVFLPYFRAHRDN